MDNIQVTRGTVLHSKSNQPWRKILDILRELGREVLAEKGDAYDDASSASRERLLETPSSE